MADSDFVILDDRFKRCVKTSARVEQLYTGCRWAEGPAYFPAFRSLIWSDIPNDRLLRWDEASGVTGVFRSPAGYTNGNTIDRQGRLVSCEHGNRRVSRTEPDGSITVIADRYQGKRLNSPNDVVVHGDGAVWFTDPPYGIDSDYEGHLAEPEVDGNYVYRADPATGRVRIVVDDLDRPNGLAFSPDERRLYVSDTGPSKRGQMRVFEVGEEGQLRGGELFATCTEGAFDGFRADSAGRIWASARDGVHCYDPDGTLLGKVLVPEPVANVAFGGPKRNRLFITATSSLYAVLLPVNGARLV